MPWVIGLANTATNVKLSPSVLICDGGNDEEEE